MTARLLSLVMLPVTVMCLLAGSVVFSHRSAAELAETLDHDVSVLSELIALRDALDVQNAALAFDVRLAQFDLAPAAAKEFIGFDWSTTIPPARARAGRAITVLGAGSPVSTDTLRQLYTEIDGAVISPAEAMQQIASLSQTVDRSVTRALAPLHVESHHRPLTAALGSLRTATVMVDSASFQIFDLVTALFPSRVETPEASAAAFARLGTERADYLSAANRLRFLGARDVVAELTRIEADPQVQAFEHAVTVSLAGAPIAAAGTSSDPVDGARRMAQFAKALHGYFIREGLLDRLVAVSVTTLRDEARHMAASERTTYVAWALGTCVLALATVVVALRLGRSISVPLKDLAGYAHAINDGQLDVEPSPRRNHGPRETRVAFSALADLVANLQLLDAKANALAHCDFDAPVLRVPLPGRLGLSLESSVTLLSGSIVERDQLQTHLAHEATHDALTGISNRPAAITAIQAATNRAERTGATTALLFIDLNDFKAVNDSYGHEAGDEVLRQVASRLSLGLRNGDSVARLGGDEFVVIAEGIADIADATDLAQRLIDLIGQPIEIGAAHLSIGAAVGIAMSLDGPEEPLTVLGRADAAMYRAKRHERSAIEVFDAVLQSQLLEREEIRSALAEALAEPTAGGLHLHYQPVMDTASGALVGTEALIRWDRAGHGRLVPDSFIPIAERTALIIDLDCWVLNEAARQQVAWSTVPELADVPVAVNISGRHLLSRQLPGHIRTVLDQTGINPRGLSIEVTETVLLADLVSAAAELDAVRAMGVRVAIDDFGTGYTSLAHLQQLPIDTIKIDRSFISQLNARRGGALVRMVTDLGHAIDVNIVAEGVETEEELSALRAMGADHLQGYLLCKPLEPAALSAWAHARGIASRTAPAA